MRGVANGARRLRSDALAPDGPLLATLLLTLTGYVAFTTANPWFATLKGSYMLGAVGAFALYASDGLCTWIRRPGPVGVATGAALALLFLVASAVFTIGLVFTKIDATGLPWRAAA